MDIEYSQLPYSFSLYQAFGHSLSRCIDNPDRVRPEPRNNRPRNKTDKASKKGKGQNFEEPTNHHTGNIEEDIQEDYL